MGVKMITKKVSFGRRLISVSIGRDSDHYIQAFLRGQVVSEVTHFLFLWQLGAFDHLQKA